MSFTIAQGQRVVSGPRNPPKSQKCQMLGLNRCLKQEKALWPLCMLETRDVLHFYYCNLFINHVYKHMYIRLSQEYAFMTSVRQKPVLPIYSSSTWQGSSLISKSLQMANWSLFLIFFLADSDLKEYTTSAAGISTVLIGSQ